MRKLLCVAVTVVVVALLCGCDLNEPDRRYIAATMGFDAVEEGLLLSVEAVVINSENIEEDIKTEVFSAVGKTPEECLYNLSSTLPKNLTLTHCGVMAAGDGVSGEELLGIIEFGEKHREINLSAYIVSVKKAAELIKLKPTSALALGFEVMSAIEQSSEKTGVIYANRIYEIKNSLTARSPAFMLARFSVAEENFSLVGSRICLNGEPKLDLDVHDTVVYSLMRNTNNGGSLAVQGSVCRINSPYTYFEAEPEENGVGIDLDIRVSKLSKAACEDIEATAHRLFGTAQCDLFGFADRMYAKYPKLRDKLSGNVQAVIGNASFNVTCETGKQKDEA